MINQKDAFGSIEVTGEKVPSYVRILHYYKATSLDRDEISHFTGVAPQKSTRVFFHVALLTDGSIFWLRELAWNFEEKTRLRGVEQ